MILLFLPGRLPRGIPGEWQRRATAAMGARSDDPRGKLDAFRLARERGIIEGRVDPRRLSRLADLITDGPALVAWRIAGVADAMGRPALAVELNGTLTLTCQRCLGDFAWSIDERTELLLAKDERELADLDAGSDAEVVLAAQPLDPLTLIEDELVLALPFAPRHPDDACSTELTTRRP